jgi:hypothetical protein
MLSSKDFKGALVTSFMDLFNKQCGAGSYAAKPAEKYLNEHYLLTFRQSPNKITSLIRDVKLPEGCDKEKAEAILREEIASYKKEFSKTSRNHYFAAGCTTALTLSADLYLLSQAFVFGYIVAAAITIAGALAINYFWNKGSDLAEKEIDAALLSS